MKNALKLFGFTVLVVLFYSYVGQMVPQQRTYPPEELELSADMSTQEMVEVGERIVQGKGTCLTCHAVGGDEGGSRFPNLAGIGVEAGDRREGYSAVAYLAESLYEPNAYVVEGYTPAMPPAAQPPIDLTDQEIKAVIAYLQSLGGTPTVTMATDLSYGSGAADGGPADGETSTGDARAASSGSEDAGSEDTAPETPADSGEDGESGTDAQTASADGSTLFTKYQCQTCHTVETDQPGVGPSLHDVGDRLSREEIRTSIMEPNETIAEGYQPQVMSATLEAAGFFDQITDEELEIMVDYLAAQTGN